MVLPGAPLFWLGGAGNGRPKSVHHTTPGMGPERRAQIAWCTDFLVYGFLGACPNSTKMWQKQQGRAFGAPHRGAERPCGCCFCFMLVELWCAPRVLCTKNSVHQDPCSPLWAQSCPVGRFLKAFTNIEQKQQPQGRGAPLWGAPKARPCCCCCCC